MNLMLSTKCKYKAQLQFVIKQIRFTFLFIYHMNLFIHMATRKGINCYNYFSNKWSNWSIIELFDLLIYSCICIYWYNSFSSFFFYQKIFILIFINFFGSWFIILFNFSFLFPFIFFLFTFICWEIFYVIHVFHIMRIIFLFERMEFGCSSCFIMLCRKSENLSKSVPIESFYW